MAQVLTNINLSNAQKRVLLAVNSAPTPKVAAEEISSEKKLSVARDQMVDLKMIKFKPGSAILTSAGEQLMKDESLVNDMGEITPEAEKLIPNEKPKSNQPMETVNMSLIKKIQSAVIIEESTQINFSDDEKKAILAIEKGSKELDIGSPLYEKLYNYFSEDMPYGIQKAREGDPDQWILDHLRELIVRF